jgi:hypothetical protein
MPRLRWLDLRTNQITGAGELRELNLAGNHLDNGAAQALAACRHLSHLYGLALGRAAHQAGIPHRGDNGYWVDADRSRREPFRNRELV